MFYLAHLLRLIVKCVTFDQSLIQPSLFRWHSHAYRFRGGMPNAYEYAKACTVPGSIEKPQKLRFDEINRTNFSFVSFPFVHIEWHTGPLCALCACRRERKKEERKLICRQAVKSSCCCVFAGTDCCECYGAVENFENIT